MRNFFIPLLLLLGAACYGQVVKDTIYADALQDFTDKSQATYYFLYNGENEVLTDIENYDITDNKLVLKGKGTVVKDQNITWNGPVTLYDKQGKETLIYDFDSLGNITKLDSFDPLSGTKYTVSYLDNQMVQGQLVHESNGLITYMQIEDFLTKSVSYISLENPQNRADYIYNNGQLEQTMYFDKDAKQLYNCIYVDGIAYNGQDFTLVSQSLTISSIDFYKEAELIKTQEFFDNGQLKSATTQDQDVTSTSYWDKQGNSLGSITLKDDTYQDGNVVYYGYDNQRDNISTIYNYKNGSIVSYSMYYDKEQDPVNSIRETVVFDNPEYNNILYNDYFDKSGNKISTVSYKEGTPYNGTAYDVDKTTVYQDGQILEQTAYYEGTLDVFEQMKDKKSTFYDLKGQVIAQLDYHLDDYLELSPYQGTKITRYDNSFYDINSYNKGQLIYSGTYVYSNDNYKKPIIGKEQFYNPLTQQVVKEIYYFDNGAKRQETIFSEKLYDDQPVTSTYYSDDKKNTVIGDFDHINNHGTLMEFDYNNVLISQTKYNKGEIISKKTYTNKKDYFSDATNDKNQYYLSSEIDYDHKGVYYDKDNQIISQVIYKDKEPYEGTAIEMDTYEIIYIPYQNGQKNGYQTSYYTYDLSFPYARVLYQDGQITQEQTLSQGEVTKETNYLNGVKQGLYYELDSNGDKISDLQFDNDVPYKGYIKTDFYSVYTITKYANAVKQEREFYNAENNALMAVEKYDSNTIYHKEIFDDNQNLIFQYSVKDGLLNNDYKHFENGKLKQQANFKNGRLIQGSVSVVNVSKEDLYYSEQQINDSVYYIINKNKNNLHLQVALEKDNEIVVDLQIKIKKDHSDFNPVLSRLYAPKDLYPINDFNLDYYNYESSNLSYMDQVVEAAAQEAAATQATYQY